MCTDALQQVSPHEQPEVGQPGQTNQLTPPDPQPSEAGNVHKIFEDATTAKIAAPAINAVTPRWGAVLDNSSRKLAFFFPGQTDPVVVMCNGELIIGRGTNAGTPPDFDLSQYAAIAHGVSRHHAKIWYDTDMLKLVDLGSTNGTFLNGQRLPARQPRILRDGDEVTFGRLSVRINVM